VVERITYTPELPYRAADKYLMPSERIVTTVRMHPMAIVKPALLIVGGAILAGFLAVGAHGNGRLTLAVWLLWGALFLWHGRKIVIWWRRYFVVTENRLMLVTSLIFTDVAMMPLAKVTDMRLSESILGRMLHYGEFIVESAGQEQALSHVRFVPYPSQIYQEILSLIFPDKPAAAGPQGPLGRVPGAGGPSWPDAPLRGRGGGSSERPGDDPGF
jgi:hypothetical protein